jgi:hypothetical protein
MRACVLVAIVLAAAPLSATMQRSFVSTSGSDTNTCARDQPCRNFAAALAQTTAGGEVVAIDSGGYGVIPSITQSVSIIAPLGVYAGISVFSGAGITINDPNSTVILRNLSLTALGGADGIAATNVKSLTIDHGVIIGFSNDGINFAPGATLSQLVVADSVVRGCQTAGVQISGTAGFQQRATIVHSRFEENENGVVAFYHSRVAVFDSVCIGNQVGFLAAASGAGDVVRLQLEGCAAIHNDSGIIAGQPVGMGSCIVNVSNCTIVDNLIGLDDTSSAQILSRQNNTLENNSSGNGTFTDTYSAK